VVRMAIVLSFMSGASPVRSSSSSLSQTDVPSERSSQCLDWHFSDASLEDVSYRLVCAASDLWSRFEITPLPSPGRVLPLQRGSHFQRRSGLAITRVRLRRLVRHHWRPRRPCSRTCIAVLPPRADRPRPPQRRATPATSVSKCDRIHAAAAAGGGRDASYCCCCSHRRGLSATGRAR
jgi:hypothetical protein